MVRFASFYVVVALVENGIKLRLNVDGTPGFADQVNSNWDPIIKCIKDQHSTCLRKELTAMRDWYIQDTRIHCCLYFISPTRNNLRPIDLIVTKLSKAMNIFPSIAKAGSSAFGDRESLRPKVTFFPKSAIRNRTPLVLYHERVNEKGVRAKV
ncbi:hypothetical protein H1R20_g3956, partial [Candolleomyces eurysporus]